MKETRIVEWRPDGKGDGRTWAEIMAVVLATDGPVEITCPQPDADYQITPGDWDAARITLSAEHAVEIKMAQEARLENFKAITGPVTLTEASKPNLEKSFENRHQRRARRAINRRKKTRR